MGDIKPIKKNRRWLWRIMLGLFAAIIVLAALILWPTGPIVPGPDTTVLTGPLNPDGTVNYLQALNELRGRGVTPDNNAVPLIIQAIGPKSIEPGFQTLTYSALGMAELPADGDYFVEGFARQPTTQRSAGRKAADESDKMLEAAGERLWKDDDFPVIAAWLRQNARPLDLLTKASDRPRFYWPYLAKSGSLGAMTAGFPQLVRLTSWRRALCARAMLRARNGDIDGAWEDLRTALRLARLLGQYRNLLLDATAADVEKIAGQALLALTQSPGFTRAHAATILAELLELPIAIDLATTIDQTERYIHLDELTALMTLRLSAVGPHQSGWWPKFKNDCLFDKNDLLRLVNRWYSRAADALRQPTYSKRKSAVDALVSDFAAEFEHPKALSRAWFSRFRMTNVLGSLSAGGVRTIVEKLGNIQDKAEMRHRLAILAVALAAYRLSHDAYPSSLDALSPEPLKAIPGDIFADDAPLKYRLEGKGYRLYSVGPNMRDDGGKTAEEHLNCDDIVVKAEK